MTSTTRRSLLACVSVFSLLAAACESSSTSDGFPNTGTGTGTGTGSSSSGDPGGPVEPSCPATTHGPTLHEGGDVAKNEAWTADGSPHVVTGDVRIRNGATLVIEPCAEVAVAKGKHLQVAYPGTPNTGALVAEGTAKRPIRIHGQDGARWASLYVQAPGTARLAHVSFAGGGGGDFEDGATLHALGDGEDGGDPILFVDHVSIKGSLGFGALLNRGAAFVAGSNALTIAGSGGYPLAVSEHALDALPTGAYTSNAKDEILVDPEGGRIAGSGFLADATVHDRGVPYHVGRSSNESLTIGGREDGKLVTVTIEPGVTMRFEAGGALKVQHFTNQDPSTGALRAIGTAAKPILLTSAKTAPAPGDWRGIWYGGVPRSTNAIEHVKIEYAGGDCGCILLTCSAISEHEGAIIFTAQPPSAFVKNTTFSAIAGHGITEGYDGGFIDFRPTNTFSAVAGCAQTRPRENPTSCPSPKPACD